MKLLDQFRESCRMRHLAPKTERVYAHWVEEFCRFQHQRVAKRGHSTFLHKSECPLFFPPFSSPFLFCGART
ncbi:MAG: hypothetical protein C0483_12140 [Pirellula sp.]|nr:hypothetical protein [Pirellula sp.]